MSEEVNINDDQKKESSISANNEESLAEDGSETPKTDTLSKDTQELPLGEALKINETYKITAATKTKFIVLAGVNESGKTTLITSIYHLLQRSSFAGYIFAGSKTLIGFEHRSHPARISSENTVPLTRRTRRSVTDCILHLRLRDQECQKKIQDLLITDFSGEDYDAIIANVGLAQSEFQIIKRADRFILLIDGNSLSNKETRHGAKQQSITLLKTLRDAELLNHNSSVDVVISKYDIVKPKYDSDPAIKQFIDTLESDIVSEFRENFRDLRIFKVAARPNQETKEIGLGYGLEKLIPNWLEPDPEWSHNKQIEVLPEGLSQFDLFATRTFRTQI